MRRFLVPLAAYGLTILLVSPILAKGGPMHLFPSQLPPVSRAGVPTLHMPSPNQFFSGCGHGRYRDAATQRCRGPADVGN